MSIYIQLYLILMFSAFISTAKKKIVDFDKRIYFILFFLLSVFLVLRYGQGTDYFNYKEIYDLAPKKIDFQTPFYKYAHTEIGWKLLNQFFVTLSLPYEALVILISIIELWQLNSFIEKYCKKNRFIALLLIYPTFYLSYVFSALRQGLVMCIFLGSMLKALEDKKYFKYIGMTIVCSLIHAASLIYIVFLFADYMKAKDLENLCALALLMGLFIYYGGLTNYLYYFMPDLVKYYFSGGEIGWFTLLERIITLMLIRYMMHQIKVDGFLYRLYKIYLIGVIIYFLICWMPAVASRLYFMWKIVEIVFLIAFCACRKKTAQIILIYFALLSSMRFVGNLNADIIQGDYNSEVNMWNYPYVSIFEKEKIFEYRALD